MGQGLLYLNENIIRSDSSKNHGFSVRCLKDITTNLPPVVPSDPLPINGEVNKPINTTLSWTCSDPENDPMTYDVYFGTDNPPSLVLTGQSETTFNPGTLAYNISYYWKIVAHDDHSNFTEGTIWSFSTIANQPPSSPSDPMPIDGAVNQPIDTTLSWTCSDPENDPMIYDIYFGTDNPPSLALTGQSETTFNPGTLAYNISYYWKIVAHDDHSNFTEGTIWSFSTIANQPPSSPSDPMPIDGAVNQPIDTTLSWTCSDPENNPITYNIYFGTDNPPSLVLSGQSETTFNPGTIAYNISYYWKIVAHDDHSNFTEGTIWNFSTIANQPPSAPSNPMPIDGALYQPINTTLSWVCTDPENDPMTYDVYFGSINPPSLLVTGQTESAFNPGAMAYNTSYYWKIVAHDFYDNSTEGPVFTFTTKAWQCSEPMVDTRDGQTYSTMQINAQCWMSENLNIGTMIPGETDMADNSIIEKFCYDNDTANCEVYGGLYQWKELMQYTLTTGVQGICPEGWHIPTDLEWTLLTNYLGGTGVAGGKMKENRFCALDIT